MLKQKKFNLYSISEARNVIFGIATLWIGLFHSDMLSMAAYTGKGFFNSVFKNIKSTGNVGVDIFLLLSGIGLYFSFSKDSRVLSFWKKRLLRVLPTAIRIATCYFSIRYATGRYSDGLGEYISRMTFTYFYWKGERVFWFVSLIIVLYLLFPLMYKAIDRFHAVGMAVMILGVIGLGFILRAVFPGYYELIEIAICRIPIFIFGIWMGRFVMEKREISFWWVPISLAIGIGMLMILKFFHPICHFIDPSYTKDDMVSFMFIYRYAGSVMALCMTVQLSWIITAIRKRGHLNGLRNFFEFVGMYSLEYYMIYLNIANFLNRVYKIPPQHQIMLYFGTFVVSLVLCVMVRKVCDFFMTYMRRKPKTA